MADLLVPYFYFNGNCAEAVEFYAKALGAESQILRYGDAPPNPNFPSLPEEAKNLVLHGEVRKDGHTIRFSDVFPGTPYSVGNNITFSMNFKTEDEVKSMFETLSAGGQVHMEPQKTFFSPCFCKFADKFGIIWQLVLEHQR